MNQISYVFAIKYEVFNPINPGFCRSPLALGRAYNVRIPVIRNRLTGQPNILYLSYITCFRPIETKITIQICYAPTLEVIIMEK